MIITISGLPGSGKSTIGRVLAKKLGYKFYSMGDLRGKLALERGMTIDEFNKLGETEEWTDKDIDAYQKKLGETEDNFIVDGRLSFHFIPQSFKIFLDVDLRAGAERVFKNQRPDERRVASAEEMQEIMAKRIEHDDLRYKKYYGLSFRDKNKFDLVLDTTDLTQEEVVDRIMTHLKIDSRTTK